MVIIPVTHPKPGYTVDSFAPVTNIAVMPNIIAVLKANLGKYAFATSGKGSINHTLGQSFQARAGVKLNHVPYNGAGPAMQDVMSARSTSWLISCRLRSPSSTAASFV